VYLVDTDVISASAPRRGVAAADVVQWMDEHSSSLYISAVTAAEIEGGIAQARREGARRKAADLAGWLEALLHLYASRVLVFDLPTARIAGTLSDLVRSRGAAPGFADIAIAATARRHELTILTRICGILGRWRCQCSIHLTDCQRRDDGGEHLAAQCGAQNPASSSASSSASRSPSPKHLRNGLPSRSSRPAAST
jgi:toxin FitB